VAGLNGVEGRTLSTPTCIQALDVRRGYLGDRPASEVGDYVEADDALVRLKSAGRGGILREPVSGIQAKRHLAGSRIDIDVLSLVAFDLGGEVDCIPLPVE
jgi:hypothetical protein